MDKVKATVIGELEVAGVAPGGTVELDPAEVNIAALVDGGHIKLGSGKGATGKADG